MRDDRPTVSKLIATLPPNTVFSLVLPMFFPQLPNKSCKPTDWEGEKTVKCPNNFD